MYHGSRYSFVKVSGYQNRSMELRFIGDGDSSVYHAVVTRVPLYGRYVQKLSVPTMPLNVTGTTLKHYVRIIQNINLSVIRIKRGNNSWCLLCN